MASWRMEKAWQHYCWLNRTCTSPDVKPAASFTQLTGFFDF
jgi:hypothetical protein